MSYIDPTTSRGDMMARGANSLQRVPLPTVAGQPAMLGSDGTDLTAIGGKLGCEVYLNANQNISSSGVDTALAWTAEAYDNGGFHSGSSSQIIIPSGADGLYLCWLNVVFASNNTGLRALKIFKNTVVYRIPVQQAPLNGATTRLSFAVPLRLVAGDVIEYYVNQTSGGALIVNGDVNAATTAGGVVLIPGQ